MKRWCVYVVAALSVAGICGEAAAAGTLDRRIVAVQGGIVRLGGDLKDVGDELDTIYTYGASVAFPLGDYIALLGSVGRTSTGASHTEGDLKIDLDIVDLSIAAGVRLHWISDMPVAPFVAALYGRSKSDFTLKAAEIKGKLESTRNTLTLAIGGEWSITDRLSVIGTFAHIKELSSSEKLKIDGLDNGFNNGFDWNDNGWDDDDWDDDDWDDDDWGDLDLNGDLDLDGINDTDSTNVLSLGASFYLTDTVLISGLIAHEMEEKTNTYQIGLGFTF